MLTGSYPSETFRETLDYPSFYLRHSADVLCADSPKHYATCIWWMVDLGSILPYILCWSLGGAWGGGMLLWIIFQFKKINPLSRNAHDPYVKILHESGFSKSKTSWCLVISYTISNMSNIIAVIELFGNT